jgi:hypothetical protein
MTGKIKAVLSLAAASLVGTLAYRDAQAADDIEVLGAVQGLSGTCPNLRFSVGGQPVSTDDGTDFDDGECSDLKNGTHVEVEGEHGTDGVLLADDVDLDPGG